MIERACTVCGALSDRSRCPAHRKDSRPSASQRGYNEAWRRTRARVLSMRPLCEDPAGCIDPATEVHHLDGEGPLSPRGHDDSNLRALCGYHHKVTTSREQPGGFNR